MLKIPKYNTITGKKIDLKELEKYGFKKQGGTEEEHYHWGYYTKKIFKLFSNDIVIVIPFRNADKKIIFARYYNYLKEDFETKIHNPKLKKKYINILIKDGYVVKEDNK